MSQGLRESSTVTRDDRTPVKVLFIGGTKRGHRALRALIDGGATICGVISLEQDAHEVERFEHQISTLSSDSGIPHFQSKWMKDRDYPKLIEEELRPDVAIVVGCRILIPERIYRAPRLGTLAVHDSLLPAYRGFAPLNWCLINGETRTGVTLFYVDDGMDTGDIAGQTVVPIGPDETAPDLYDRICDETASLVLAAYLQLQSGTVSRRPQNQSEATFGCSRTPDDGMIDWSSSTQSIYNKVRALTHPYPGAFTFLNNARLIIDKAIPSPHQNTYVGRVPGRVVGRAADEGYVDVITGNGVLRLLEVHLETGTRTQAASLIKSVRCTLGLNAIDLLVQVQALEARVAQIPVATPDH